MSEMKQHLPDGLVEVLEWRKHGSHDQITYTEFGPYMIDRTRTELFRAWLPDDSQNARIMVEAVGDEEAAKAFCQSDLDGRRALKMVKDCAIFLANGETPAERIERERKDVDSMLLMLAAEREKLRATHQAAEVLENEVVRLQDLNSELVEALKDARHLLWELGVGEEALQPVRSAIAKTQVRS